MNKTLVTLIHSENRAKVVTALFMAVVLIADYSGTLPAPLEAYRDWIELAAYIILGLSLVHIDPKRELPK